jgi:hypothetical protein
VLELYDAPDDRLNLAVVEKDPLTRTRIVKYLWQRAPDAWRGTGRLTGFPRGRQEQMVSIFQPNRLFDRRQFANSSLREPSAAKP